MRRKIRKHIRYIYPPKKLKPKEILYTQSGSIMLNKSRDDRISYSVLRNKKNDTTKIENISYEIQVNGNWEWVVRYDDHGGVGQLHRHVRVSLIDQIDVESSVGIRKYRNKSYQLTWVCNDIKRNYLNFRFRFLKHSGLDLY